MPSPRARCESDASRVRPRQRQSQNRGGPLRSAAEERAASQHALGLPTELSSPTTQYLSNLSNATSWLLFRERARKRKGKGSSTR